MRLYTRIDRRAVSCSLTVTIILVSSAIGFSQGAPNERSFSTGENPYIVISNASVVQIESWDKSEVSIKGEVLAEAVQASEVTIKSNKNKIDVSCHPAKPDRRIFLTLRTPPKAHLEIRSGPNLVDVRDPAGQITIIYASRDIVQLNLPVSAALDMEQAPSASVRRPILPGGSVTMGIGRSRIGTGPPFVKVISAKQQVIVTLGSVQAPTPQKPVTMAAQTIARRGGMMGQALRKAYPHLIRPQRDQTPQVNPAERDEDALKLETHLINLNVSATDSAGKSIPGLKKEDFSVYEDGVLQQLSFFSPEQAPFNLVLLVDLSGSMRDEIELIKQTAKHFLDVIGSQDRVAVVNFTTDVTVVSFLTKDRDDLRESIDYMLAPAGGTAFYDALGYTLVEVLRKVKGQRNAIIAISDGEDNALQAQLLNATRPVGSRSSVGSFLTFDELLEGATEGDSLIYPIHLNPASPQPMILSNPPGAKPPAFRIQADLTAIATKQLQSLADASGARLYHANRIEDLKGVFELVAAELRTIYSMAYTPTNQSFDGRFRRIQVKVNRPGVAVRTRPGYVGR